MLATKSQILHTNTFCEDINLGNIYFIPLHNSSFQFYYMEKVWQINILIWKKNLEQTWMGVIQCCICICSQITLLEVGLTSEL